MSKDDIDALTDEERIELFHGRDELLEWYLAGRPF
jgi:hypothetical protein